MEIKEIKPIPNYIAKIIRKKDATREYCGNVRFYAYFAKMKGELVKITVVCKNYEKQWFCKQVAVHGVHSDNCLVRDMEYYMMGYSIGWYSMGLSDFRKPYEDGKWYSAGDKFYDPAAEVVNKKYALKFDEYKYSAVDKYPYTDIIKYLRIYEKLPQAEYFIKIGLQHLATNKTLLKKAAKDKNFRKWLIRNARQLRNEYGNYPYFSAQVILSSYKENRSILEGQKLDKAKKELQRDYNFTNTISKIIPDNEIDKFIEYIQKQNTNINSYADYVKACNYLGLDMNIPKNRYPHDFKRWHDIRIDQYHTAKAIADEKERAELYKQFATVAQKYEGLQYQRQADFIMLIPHSPAELICEGEQLSHCVGRMGYDQKMVREETLIFFVRNITEPDKPFVTVEFSIKQHKVLQCYGYKDTKPNESVLNFVNRKWLPYANRQLNKILAVA